MTRIAQASGAGMREYVQHLSTIDYVAISGKPESGVEMRSESIERYHSQAPEHGA